jgi:hypothetical protein
MVLASARCSDTGPAGTAVDVVSGSQQKIPYAQARASQIDAFDAYANEVIIMVPSADLASALPILFFESLGVANWLQHHYGADVRTEGKHLVVDDLLKTLGAASFTFSAIQTSDARRLHGFKGKIDEVVLVDPAGDYLRGSSRLDANPMQFSSIALQEGQYKPIYHTLTVINYHDASRLVPYEVVDANDLVPGSIFMKLERENIVAAFSRYVQMVRERTTVLGMTNAITNAQAARMLMEDALRLAHGIQRADLATQVTSLLKARMLERMLRMLAAFGLAARSVTAANGAPGFVINDELILVDAHGNYRRGPVARVGGAVSHTEDVTVQPVRDASWRLQALDRAALDPDEVIRQLHGGC